MEDKFGYLGTLSSRFYKKKARIKAQESMNLPYCCLHLKLVSDLTGKTQTGYVLEKGTG
jgi:hypothetical protein